jgi:hypothetical protein
LLAQVVVMVVVDVIGCIPGVVVVAQLLILPQQLSQQGLR